MKKTIFLLMLSVSSISLAQNVDCNVKNKKDEFTGKESKWVPRVNIAGFSKDKKPLVDYMFAIEMEKSNGLYYVTFYFPKEVYCLAKKSSYVSFKLENDEIVKIAHNRKTVCDKGAWLKGYIVVTDFNKLRDSPIKAIRMVTESFTIDAGNIREPNYFINTLECLSN